MGKSKRKNRRQEKWFTPSEIPLGWKKSDPMDKRRRTALKNRGNDHLATGRALQALANVTTDKRTKELAQKDANYFFRIHRMNTRTRHR